MPLDQAVLEHQSLGVVETADGPRTRIVLVAARREMIDSLLAAARGAGLKPEGVDLSAFAMIRALHRSGDGSSVLYVSVGGMTNLAVSVGSTCTFTRVVAHGTESMASELAERRGLTLEHAHGWLKHAGLEAPIDEVDGDQEILGEARVVLSDGVARIADEVRNSLDFYRMQEGSATVDRTVVTGPALAIPGFADQLGEQIGMPVERGLVAEAKPGAFGGVDAGRLSVATGLAVEQVAS